MDSRRPFRFALPLLALLVTLGGAALRAETDHEREARIIEDMLIAPCCFSQQVSVHQSDAAVKVKADVRARLAAGETREEIIDAYVAMYGARVLSTPPPEGVNLLLYITPVFVLVTSIGLVVFVVRRFSGQASPASAAEPAAARTGDGALESRLDDELRELD